MYTNTTTGSLSRFSPSRFIEFNSETKTYDPASSLFFLYLRKLKASSTYKIKEKDGRPDAVSYNLYGTPDLWWILLWYNDYRFFYEMKHGDTIKYPSLQDIDNIILSMQQKDGMWI